MAEKFTIVEPRVMPSHLFDVGGNCYKLETTQVFYGEGEYETAGTYTFDGSIVNSPPAKPPPRRQKRLAWEEGLLMCKKADKKWKEELETRRRGTRG